MRAVSAQDIDLIVIATVTPDMMMPATAATIADQLGCVDAAAYDLSAGCTGFMYALAQGHATVAAGLAKRALVIGGDVMSRILDWTDRSTVVLFGDGAGAVVLEHVDEGGFLGFELGADGSGGADLDFPGSGSRAMLNGEKSCLQMNGREVFKFATRILESSAVALLETCGCTVDDVDVYVPHQANIRIIDHAVKKLGFPEREGGCQRGSFRQHFFRLDPLALADATQDGRIEPGKLVLMTGMGAGLTWGSALIRWTHSTNGARV